MSLRAIDVQPVVRFGVVEYAIDGRKGENDERYEPNGRFASIGLKEKTKENVALSEECK